MQELPDFAQPDLAGQGIPLGQVCGADRPLAVVSSLRLLRTHPPAPHSMTPVPQIFALCCCSVTKPCLILWAHGLSTAGSCKLCGRDVINRNQSIPTVLQGRLRLRKVK